MASVESARICVRRRVEAPWWQNPARLGEVTGILDRIVHLRLVTPVTTVRFGITDNRSTQTQRSGCAAEISAVGLAGQTGVQVRIWLVLKRRFSYIGCQQKRTPDVRGKTDQDARYVLSSRSGER